MAGLRCGRERHVSVMIDRETARQGFDALSVAIGTLLEDHTQIALTKQVTRAQRAASAERLAQLSQDLVALTAAIQVLTRRPGRPGKNPMD
jgi:hypothetical protein